VAIEALDMPLAARNPEPGLIHQSDRAVQYACADYSEKLAAPGVPISMSRAGNPYDNAKRPSVSCALSRRKKRTAKFMRRLTRPKIHIGAFREVGYVRRLATNPRS
jgi:putative transposase